ncbi:MAG: MarR family transcriptional regulator [Rhizobiales bacterium]|nr:MarR family transcriptional regulator [Hyphomicrobiales bacterium]
MSKEAGEKAFSAWTGLWRAQGRILGAVEGALKDAGLPPLSWYDVLIELERAGEDGLRPFELERAILLPQYGLSRLLDRIERDGYLQRRPCPEDRRGLNIVITAEGKALRKRMWPVYGAAIKDKLENKLSDAELEALGGLLGKLLERQ